MRFDRWAGERAMLPRRPGHFHVCGCGGVERRRKWVSSGAPTLHPDRHHDADSVFTTTSRVRHLPCQRREPRHTISRFCKSRVRALSMDLKLRKADLEFQAQVREFVDEHWPERARRDADPAADYAGVTSPDRR